MPGGAERYMYARGRAGVLMELVANLDFFKGVSSLKLCEQICKYLRPMSLKKGEDVFRQGGARRVAPLAPAPVTTHTHTSRDISAACQVRNQVRNLDFLKTAITAT